jgi:hypothetical protein
MKRTESGMTSTFGNLSIYLREGGIIDLVCILKEILGIDSLLTGLSTARDNIHAFNESIGISMLEKERNFFGAFCPNSGIRRHANNSTMSQIEEQSPKICYVITAITQMFCDKIRLNFMPKNCAAILGLMLLKKLKCH